MIIDLADLVGVAAGEPFGFILDAAIDVRVLNPGTVDIDAADATAMTAEMPMGTFAIAVTLSSVYFHVVAGATQGNF